MSKKNSVINDNICENAAETAAEQTDLTNFEELANVKGDSNAKKGRKLTARESTFCIDEGPYKAVITNAFWYKNDNGEDRIMFVYELEDGTEFKNSVDGDWVEDYPFSKLISQANVEYVDDFKGLKVKFDIRNSEGETMTFSNIRKISLDE